MRDTDGVTLADVEMARLSLAVLKQYVQDGVPLALRLEANEREFPVELPAATVRMLLTSLEAIAAGQRQPVLTKTDVSSLTTTQAARILGVSRPHVVKLLEAGAIPYQMVGTHRRIHPADLHGFLRTQRIAEQT